jgi:hypothetical protein
MDLYIKTFEFFDLNYEQLKFINCFSLNNISYLKNFSYLNELCNKSYLLFTNINQIDSTILEYIFFNWDIKYIKTFFKIIKDVEYKINKKKLLINLLNNLSDSFLEESIEFYHLLLTYLFDINYFDKSIIVEPNIIHYLSIQKVFDSLINYLESDIHKYTLPFPVIYHCTDNIKIFDYIYNDAVKKGLYNDKISNPNVFDFYSNNENLQFSLDYILSIKYRFNTNWKTYLKLKLNKEKLEYLKDLYNIQLFVENNNYDKLDHIFNKYRNKDYCITPNTRINHNYPLFYYAKNTTMLLFLFNYGLNIYLETTYWLYNTYKINYIVLCKNNIEILYSLYNKGLDFSINKNYLKKFTSLSRNMKINKQYHKLLSHSNKFIQKEKYIIKKKLQSYYIKDILNRIIDFI